MANAKGSTPGNNDVRYDYGTSDDKKSDSRKLQGLVEILKISLGGKPKCIVTLWVKMRNSRMFLKMVLVTWSLMKKELILIERNTLLLTKSCIRNITR